MVNVVKLIVPVYANLQMIKNSRWRRAQLLTISLYSRVLLELSSVAVFLLKNSKSLIIISTSDQP